MAIRLTYAPEVKIQNLGIRDDEVRITFYRYGGREGQVGVDVRKKSRIEVMIVK